MKFTPVRCTPVRCDARLIGDEWFDLDLLPEIGLARGEDAITGGRSVDIQHNYTCEKVIDNTIQLVYLLAIEMVADD